MYLSGFLLCLLKKLHYTFPMCGCLLCSAKSTREHYMFCGLAFCSFSLKKKLGYTLPVCGCIALFCQNPKITLDMQNSPALCFYTQERLRQS